MTKRGCATTASNPSVKAPARLLRYQTSRTRHPHPRRPPEALRQKKLQRAEQQEVRARALTVPSPPESERRPKTRAHPWMARGLRGMRRSVAVPPPQHGAGPEGRRGANKPSPRRCPRPASRLLGKRAATAEDFHRAEAFPLPRDGGRSRRARGCGSRPRIPRWAGHRRRSDRRAALPCRR